MVETHQGNPWKCTDSMTTFLRTPIARFINRLLDLPPFEDTGALEGHLKILDEAIDADAFVVLGVDPGREEGRILAGIGLRTTGAGWQKALETSLITELASRSIDSTVSCSTGPFDDDPFLKTEKARSLLVKGDDKGGVFLITVALRRDNGPFTRSESEKFAALAGVINLQCRCRFSGNDQEMAQNKNKLTSLGVFSDFHQALAVELSRARRGGGAVTMGIMSIAPQDPALSDNVLLDVTRSLHSQLRDFDTLTRYGLQELAFILPQLKGLEGVRVVDRVKKEIVSSLGGENKAPEFYIGLSCYPEDGATVERLIEMAEAAMNMARDESHPGVYRWEE
jgi:hypothetical protein